MNWIVVLSVWVISSIGIMATYKLKVAKLERRIFDLNWEYKEQTNEHNKMKLALSEIAKGGLLKREMVELAQKSLEVEGGE